MRSSDLLKPGDCAAHNYCSPLLDVLTYWQSVSVLLEDIKGEIK